MREVSRAKSWDASELGLAQESISRVRQGAAALAGTIAQDGKRAFVFTGATAGCGTTTLALETARQLRDSLGLRVLVVLLDGRLPRRAKRPELKPEPNLASLRSSDTGLSECIQRGPYELPCVMGVALQSDGSHSKGLTEGLRRVIEESQTSFDAVIVDAPPVLASAESMTACQAVGDMVLVVRAGATRYEVLDRIVRDVAEWDVNIVGTILNRHRRIIPNWFYRAFLQ